MMQSSLRWSGRGGLHAAIIMDGNGRWARARGLARTAGHRAGAEAVRRTVTAAPELGVSTLTLYAFSADNWQRPQAEVRELMRLLRASLNEQTRNCVRNGVRLSVIGRRDRLPRPVRMAIETAEAMTRAGRNLHLRLAIDYSARDEILRACGQCPPGLVPTREQFARLLGRTSDEPVPDVDLLIRTSGEQRLSDFLLWECAYAELYFTPTLWPDFGREDLAAALADFSSRNRRFGRVQEAAAV